MKKTKVEKALLTLTATAIAALGLAACDKGTNPGDTNVGRGEIVDEGSIIDQEDSRYSDTTDLEKYYDHTDHENHEDNTNEGYGDGAYDAEADSLDRGDVQ